VQIKQNDRLTTGVFFTAVVFGGLNAIMVRFTLAELPPFWGGLIRFLPASLILFLLVAALRLPMPRGRALLGPVLLGVLQMGGSFGLMYYGLADSAARHGAGASGALAFADADHGDRTPPGAFPLAAAGWITARTGWHHHCFWGANGAERSHPILAGDPAGRFFHG
jgi:hypothetical protein